MWQVIQFGIISAVGVANAHFHWTPNPNVASALGYGLAWIFVGVADGFQYRSSEESREPQLRSKAWLLRAYARQKPFH
jgi:hypothetical protein